MDFFLWENTPFSHFWKCNSKVLKFTHSIQMEFLSTYSSKCIYYRQNEESCKKSFLSRDSLLLQKKNRVPNNVFVGAKGNSSSPCSMVSIILCRIFRFIALFFVFSRFINIIILFDGWQRRVESSLFRSDFWWTVLMACKWDIWRSSSTWLLTLLLCCSTPK